MDDLIDGIYRLLHSDEWSRRTSATPAEMTILEFAEKVVELTGSSLGDHLQGPAPDDPKVRQPDITKATAVLGWEPKVDLDTGLKRTLEYFQRKIASRRARRHRACRRAARRRRGGV